MSNPHSGTEGFDDTVEEIVAHLEQDPILVEQIMGNGYAQELHAFLTAKAKDASYPVYVVYTATPSGLSASEADEELASLVHAEIGKDGVYVVQTSEGYGHVGIWGDLDPGEDDDETLISLANSTVSDQITAEVKSLGGDEVNPAHPIEAAAALEVAAHDSIPDYREPILTAAELPEYRHEMWSSDHWPYPEYEDDPELASDGLLALVGTLTAVVVWAVAYRLLQALGSRRLAPASGSASSARGRARTSRASLTPAARTARELAAHRTRATEELAALDRSLGNEKKLTKVGPERADLASRSHRAGAGLLGSEDPLDLVGAAVLARIGNRALGREGDDPYRCCYINPLHGEGDLKRRIAGGLTVPVCTRCDQTMQKNRQLDALVEVRSFAVDGPYYNGRTVWAETGYGALVDDLWRHVEEADR